MQMTQAEPGHLGRLRGMEGGRITIDPRVMGGEPCIRGHRMPVSTLVRLVADGWSKEQILADWPFLEPEDIAAALRFAAEASRIRYENLRETP